MSLQAERPPTAGGTSVRRRLRLPGQRGGPAGKRARRGPRPPTRWQIQLARWDIRFSPYLLVAPFFVLFAAFGLYPMAFTAWVSLHNRDLFGVNEWAGLDQYTKLAADPYFWNALGNTLGMFVAATVPQLLIALGLAHILNRRLRMRTLFRMGVLIPNITSVAAVALIFGQIFGRDHGLANWLLDFVGVDNINWQADRWSSWTAISVMVDWRWTGYNALIYLAAMQTTPYELYESAAIDGASRWQQFRHVTIPMLRPTIIFTVIVSTIGALQLFAEPFLFDTTRNNNGGSERQFQTVVLYLYQQFWTNGRYGYAAAIAWTLFLITVVIALVNFLLVRRIRSAD